MIILGLDPGLTHTGWGVIETHGNRHKLVACGRISAPTALPMAQRLAVIDAELTKLCEAHAPDHAAVEETFVNKNPLSALKLGQARGVALLAPARYGIEVAEYAANLVKKTIVGAGHAEKEQVAHMVKVLLGGGVELPSPDAADALAVAICHAHHFAAHKVRESV